MEEAWLPHNHKHLPALLPRFLFLHPTRHLPLHLPSLRHPYHRHSNLRRRLPLPPLKIHPPFGRPRRAILPLHRLPPQRHRPHLVLRLLPNRHCPPRRHPPRLLVLLPKQHPPPPPPAKPLPPRVPTPTRPSPPAPPQPPAPSPSTSAKPRPLGRTCTSSAASRRWGTGTRRTRSR